MWTRKCGYEDNVRQVLVQYKAFVSKNKIFQEFQKAFIEFKDVSEDFKNNTNLGVHERMAIDKFIQEVQAKWMTISGGLQNVQVHLEEVLVNWQQWNTSYNAMESYLNEAFEIFEGDEAQIQLFLEDLEQWKLHYTSLQQTSSYLMTTCDDNIANNLQQKMAVIHCNWSYLLQYAEKYGSDTINRSSFDDEMKQLDTWLLRAETSLKKSRALSVEEVSKAFNEASHLNTEVQEMETVFKSLSRRFQALVSEMAMPEIEDMMKLLKTQKEHLVNVRSLLPLKQSSLDDLMKKMEKLKGQIETMASTVVEMNVRQIMAEELEVNFQQLTDIRKILDEFSKEGFDATHYREELNYISRRFEEFHQMNSRGDEENEKLRKYQSLSNELEELLSSTSSNVLKIVLMQLHLTILSRGLSQAQRSNNATKSKEQLVKTLHYLEGSMTKSVYLIEEETRLCFDLKALANSDLNIILGSINNEDKETITSMLKLLLSMTNECSEDIQTTRTTIICLQDKISSIPVSESPIPPDQVKLRNLCNCSTSIL
jgi:hypothetical protein